MSFLFDFLLLQALKKKNGKKIGFGILLIYHLPFFIAMITGIIMAYKAFDLFGFITFLLLVAFSFYEFILKILIFRYTFEEFEKVREKDNDNEKKSSSDHSDVENKVKE